MLPDLFNIVKMFMGDVIVEVKKIHYLTQEEFIAFKKPSKVLLINFTINKGFQFHQTMKELWDASNPDMPHELRSENEWKYPIEDWYGTIVNYDENGKLKIYGNCPLEPFSYNQISSEYSKYNLDIFKRP